MSARNSDRTLERVLAWVDLPMEQSAPSADPRPVSSRSRFRRVAARLARPAVRRLAGVMDQAGRARAEARERELRGEIRSLEQQLRDVHAELDAAREILCAEARGADAQA